MATATKIQLQTKPCPVYYRAAISTTAARTASELLQENHDKYHIFFNRSGFHNHISHHLCTLFALGASPECLQKAYKDNASYQRPQRRPQASLVEQLHETEHFMQHLGPEENYSAYLQFFTDEINRTSWQQVLQKYVFAGDKRADDMLVRMFAGLLHPIIHLGFGVEFEQPALIAEALAEAACHKNVIRDLLLPAEQAAREHSAEESPALVTLLDQIGADKELKESVRWSDDDKVRGGVLARADDRMVEYAAQVRVKPSTLAENTAEMINAVAYYTAGAQRDDKAIKYDFYFIHALNCSIFFSAFLKQDWLSDANKARLLEWKIRMDLTIYVSRGMPRIRIQDIRNYNPKLPSGWREIADRVCAFADDGHAAKLIRAIAHGQQSCAPYETSEAFRLKHEDWLQLAHMAIDSVEGSSVSWVRSAGFEEAWVNVGPRL